MKQILSILAFSLLCWEASAQAQHDPKFPKTALEEDLHFVKSQLFHAHANPFTELDSLAYEARFKAAEMQLRDSMTAFELVKIVKPLFAPLSDEHARVGINLDNSVLRDAHVFLPFSLEKRGAAYLIKASLSNDTGLSAGDTVLAIEGRPIEEVIRTCADYTTGFPEQRMSKSIGQLGLAYVFAYPHKRTYQVKTTGKQVAASGVAFQQWKNYMMRSNSPIDCHDLISYQAYGKVGYINYCSFSVGSDSLFHQLELKIDEIFKQIKNDKIETLVVDVSNNSGGNSACGDLIINYFSTKSYRGYQCKWKRSDEYLALMKSWGSGNEAYEKTPVGAVIFYKSSVHKPDRHLKNRFNGKVYVVVGPSTFSSAIMFATMIKDNRIATLVGQIPDNGHPNHFGEMYGSKTPNTGLQLQFGVKEWIRPSGVREGNQLLPDKIIDLGIIKNTPELIDSIIKE